MALLPPPPPPKGNATGPAWVHASLLEELHQSQMTLKCFFPEPHQIGTIKVHLGSMGPNQSPKAGSSAVVVHLYSACTCTDNAKHLGQSVQSSASTRPAVR